MAQMERSNQEFRTQMVADQHESQRKIFRRFSGLQNAGSGHGSARASDVQRVPSKRESAYFQQ